MNGIEIKKKHSVVIGGTFKYCSKLNATGRNPQKQKRL
jgi:hypothetical protein